jgi:3D (Asp-Asp-Asp) domain-containing protein
VDRVVPSHLKLIIPAAIVAAACLTGCGTTRRLPAYEPPLAHTEFQTVRTTAYTDTESDHLKYGPRDALGGPLRAASPPPVSPGTEATATVTSDMARGVYAGPDAAGGFHPPVAGADALPSAPLTYGSAAADWSRWPAGTIFRLLNTGQLYRVDDYGWALSGRNTIDLYMPNRAMMDAWEVRREPIQIVEWGDREESLRVLRGRDKFRHIKRMVLELEGERRAAARLN